MSTARTTTHALYRFYADDGRLLYVGITNNPGQRFTDHAAEKPWWHEVRGISVETYDDRAAVLAAEKRAIDIEQPCYSKQRTPLRRPEPRRPALRCLVWACDACHKPVADGTGYIHIIHYEYQVVEKFWRDKEEREAQQRLTDPMAGRFINLRDMREWPEQARWQVHHGACDSKPDSGDYWFDVARARTHAHLLNWTAHLMEKSWLQYTDWDRLIQRMAGVDA